MIKSLTGIGECMIELSDAGEGLLRKGFAGDVVNTLWYARKGLPESVSTNFFTGLGEDELSVSMTSFLNDAGISTSDVVIVPDRRPGLYMIHLDGAERSFSYWRERSAARMLANDRERMKTVIQSSDALYVSGITLAILPDDDAQHLIELLGSASKSGKAVAFDPNIRPALWADKNRIAPTISACAAASSIVLPSFEDEVSAFGDKTPQETAERYRNLGADLVIVKNGPNATLVKSLESEMSYAAPHVETPVDTTGAGDSFNGAFLANYLQSENIEAAIIAAQQCSAEVICHKGALM